jgi:EAL domain-containing protein (putative c-di-GMP-specific phosphodiesterase class I)
VVSASAGVVHVAPQDAPPADAIEVLRRADVSRYRAKELGGGRIEADDPVIRARVSDRLALEADLRDALAADRIVAHFQAEWDLASGRLLGAEALARWVQPDGTVIGADAFVPLAEACGLVHDLGTRILRDACGAVAGWRAGGRLDDDFVLRVNLSARQLHQPDLIPLVHETLAETGLPATALCLELTESSLLVDPDRAVAVLEGLRELGVGLAIDDFGTGYSSMLYLKRLPLTSLKIDRAFVAGLPADAHDRAIVAATLQLGRALDITVTAEGVETDEQHSALGALGCERVQGFLLARPEPAEAAARLPG